jgi:ferredoxin
VTTTGARLRVDPIACDGRGLCVEVLPELITLDDWGYPIIADGEIPPRLITGAEEAIRLCPLLALHLDRSACERPGRAATKDPAKRAPGGVGWNPRSA